MFAGQEMNYIYILLDNLGFPVSVLRGWVSLPMQINLKQLAFSISSTAAADIVKIGLYSSTGKIEENPIFLLKEMSL